MSRCEVNAEIPRHKHGAFFGAMAAAALRAASKEAEPKYYLVDAGADTYCNASAVVIAALRRFWSAPHCQLRTSRKTALPSEYASSIGLAVQLLCVEQPSQPPMSTIQVRHEYPGSNSTPQIPQATVCAPLLLAAHNLFAAMPHTGDVADVKG